MRIETTIRIHARIEHQANIVRMSKDAVHERPPHFAQLFFTLWIPKQVLAALADGNIGVHAIAVHADDWLGQERCRQAHVRRYLAADQLVQLDLVGSRHHFSVAVVNFKL